MRSRPFISLVVLLAVALILVGCGSGSSGTSDPPLTVAAYLRQGNGICAKAAARRGQELKEAAAEGEGAGGNAEMKSLVDLALESVADAVGELTELHPPASQKEMASKLIKSLEAEMKKLDAAPSEALTDSAFSAPDAAARRAGLPACVI
jgi:hypothetical protein